MSSYSLNQLAKDNNESVFVLNTTPEKFGKPSRVCFDITHGGGQVRSILVDISWIPQDLSMQAPKSVILESPYFRTAIQRGHLKLVSPKDAEIALSEPEAVEERNRLNKISTDFMTADAEFSGDVLPRELEREDPLNNVKPAIVDMCMRDDGVPQEVYSRLRSMDPTLTIEDVKHVQSNLPDTARNTRIDKFIEQKLASLTA